MKFSGADSPLFAKGLEEFRAGRFFEAHEEWDVLWKDSTGDDRVFLQGLIQLAAARLLALAKGNIDGFGDEEGGMNLGLLRKEMEAPAGFPRPGTPPRR